MNEILLRATLNDFQARLLVLDEVVKAVVMAHPFPLRIEQSLKKSLPNLLAVLHDPDAKDSPGNTFEWAETEAQRWLDTLQERIRALAKRT